MAAAPAAGPLGGGDGRAAGVIGGLTHVEPPSAAARRWWRTAIVGHRR
jgi:hypothetical protein